MQWKRYGFVAGEEGAVVLFGENAHQSRHEDLRN
jgi:hypothetical protein